MLCVCHLPFPNLAECLGTMLDCASEVLLNESMCRRLPRHVDNNIEILHDLWKDFRHFQQADILPNTRPRASAKL